MIAFALAFAAFTAQPPYPTRLEPTNRPARQATDPRDNAADARRLLIDYAVCVTGRQRARVEAYLAMPFGSAEATQASSRLATDECLGSGEIRFGGSLFRGALYNALYMADFRQPPAGDPALVPVVAQDPAMVAAMSTEQRDLNTLGRFGDCVVRGASGDTRRLVMARAGSPDEGAAFQALRPVLGSCIPQGQQVNFTRTSLRFVIATSLYRMSVAARTAGQPR